MFVHHRKHLWASMASYGDSFTFVYVDDVRTSQEARLVTGTALRLLLTFLRVIYHWAHRSMLWACMHVARRRERPVWHSLSLSPLGGCGSAEHETRGLGHINAQRVVQRRKHRQCRYLRGSPGRSGTSDDRKDISSGCSQTWGHIRSLPPPPPPPNTVKTSINWCG
jgi:hypothetical protein